MNYEPILNKDLKSVIGSGQYQGTVKALYSNLNPNGVDSTLNIETIVTNKIDLQFCQFNNLNDPAKPKEENRYAFWLIEKGSDQKNEGLSVDQNITFDASSGCEMSNVKPA